MVKVEMSADVVVILRTDLAVKAGSRLVIDNGELVAVLSPDARVDSHQQKLIAAAPPQPVTDWVQSQPPWAARKMSGGTFPVPSHNDVYNAIKELGPVSSFTLGSKHFKLPAGSTQRSYIKDRLKDLLNSGKIKKVDPDKRFADYVVA